MKNRNNPIIKKEHANITGTPIKFQHKFDTSLS